MANPTRQQQIQPDSNKSNPTATNPTQRGQSNPTRPIQPNTANPTQRGQSNPTTANTQPNCSKSNLMATDPAQPGESNPTQLR